MLNNDKITNIDEWLKSRPKLRCKGKACDMRKGFFVRPEQKTIQLKQKCLLCGSDVVELNLVEDTNE